MYKQEILSRVRKTIEEVGWTTMPLAEFPNIDLVIKNLCFAAFIRIVDDPVHLEEIYKKAQGDIARICGDSAWARDLELVLLVGDDILLDYASVRKIIDDRYICRKHIIKINGENINELLADLPFWPFGDLLNADSILIGRGVHESVKGFDPDLITDLTSQRPGAKRVFEKIINGKYDINVVDSDRNKLMRPRDPSLVRTKLEALDITDFRGIRNLRKENMPLSGDVVFIYGPNGVGKTSIADALEWAITGQIGHLQQGSLRYAKGGPDPIINVFSDTHKAKVKCHLGDNKTIVRTKQNRSIERLVDSRKVNNDRSVIDYAVGTRAPSSDVRLHIEKLRDLFRGSHMLSQHDIRDFLEELDPTKRFDILTNMIGEEEFVRFKEKLSVVLRHLYSYDKDLAEEVKSQKREEADSSAKLHERQRDFERLRQTLTPSKNIEELVSELLAELKGCQCTLDEAIVQRASGEPADRKYEALTIHIETIIQGKINEINSLLVRLDSLKQGLQGHIETEKRCVILTGEIASARDILAREKVGLQEQEKILKNLMESLSILGNKREEVTRRYRNLTWIRDNLQPYIKAKKALQNMDIILSSQQIKIETLKNDLDEKQKVLTQKQDRLKELNHLIAVKTNRENALVSLLERLPSVSASLQEQEKIIKEERAIASQMTITKQELSYIQEEVNAAQTRLIEMQADYDTEAARHDVLNSFMARITELIKAAECPLCGLRFNSVEDARTRIHEHLSFIPPVLKNLASQLDEMKKDLNSKRAHAKQITEKIHSLKAESNQMRSKKAAIDQSIQSFLSDCADSNVQVSTNVPTTWRQALEQSIKKYEITDLRAEIASLKDDIDNLNSVVQKHQNLVDGLLGERNQREKERSQTFSIIRDLETNMVQRGFEPNYLPESDRLVVELNQAQNEVKELDVLAVKEESRKKDAKLSLAQIRESIKRLSEDIASKEMQLRQYELTYNRFFAECHAVGIDPENPRDSIPVVIQSLSGKRESLVRLEKKRQLILQFISLERIKHEFDILTKNEASIGKRVEELEKRESEISNWVSKLETLENEIFRQQFNVISSYLERLEPTTQCLYNRLNPHPIFGTVRIRIDKDTRALDIQAEASVAFKQIQKMSILPSDFFSDAQMNALAITIFLAGALRQRWSGMKTILIDDPVQQMDELNVCAFLDLLRGLSSKRQFIIFTCNRDFYLLALDKLDCLNKLKKGSFLAYRLEGIAPADLEVHCEAP